MIFGIPCEITKISLAQVGYCMALPWQQIKGVLSLQSVQNIGESQRAQSMSAAGHLCTSHTEPCTSVFVSTLCHCNTTEADKINETDTFISYGFGSAAVFPIPRVDSDQSD